MEFDSANSGFQSAEFECGGSSARRGGMRGSCLAVLLGSLCGAVERCPKVRGKYLDKNHPEGFRELFLEFVVIEAALADIVSYVITISKGRFSDVMSFSSFRIHLDF